KVYKKYDNKKLHKYSLVLFRSLEMSETSFLFTFIKNVFIQAYDDFYNSKNAFKYNLSYAKKFLENMKKIENKLQYQAKNNENNFYGKKVDATEAELDALGIG